MLCFSRLCLEFANLSSSIGRSGYGIEIGLKCLFLQFYYDLSDQELEERLSDDMAFRWFCGFSITERTPYHSYFCRMRKLLGIHGIGKVFQIIKEKTIDQNIMRNVFHFVDSSKITSKENTWKERNKAILDSEEQLNNSNVKKYSADKDARFGCKGKNKYWFGYKRHKSVDMSSGLIKKVAVTPANVPDQDALKHICADGGMVFGGKAYCLRSAQFTMRRKNCHSGAILKNNMSNKQKDKDKWLSKTCFPFEEVFSKLNNKARYRTLEKVQMQAFLEAIVFNIKRLLVIQEGRGIPIVLI